MKKLVCGILAHVDSGKTTLTEGLLYRAGAVRTLGRVDHKNAFLDTHDLERERGITIFAKQAILNWGDTQITLLDTPGHVDFSAETERTLRVLDYAILVISASEGVQSHTETLWHLLERYRVPTFLYVNKMDISAFSKDIVREEIRQKLSCVDFSDIGSDRFYDELAMCDETLMEIFLEQGTIPEKAIIDAIRRRTVFPCFFGAALKLDGVDEFLNGLCRFTAQRTDRSEFGARVFKISEDEHGNRLTHMKITGGVLRVKDVLCTGEREEKINQIRIYSGTKFKTADSADVGTVCAVTGLTDTSPGQGLGAEPDAQKPYLEPVLTYKVEILDGTDPQTALRKLKLLEQEDPELSIVWNGQFREIHAKMMGEIQQEVIKRIASTRLGMEIDFTHGSIAYKETIKGSVVGVGHFEPLRHYAEVHLTLEAGERGSGLRFYTDCSEDILSRNWQRLVLTHLYEKTHLGVLTGSPITDMKITLTAGRAHLKHTEGGDFRQATYRAVRQGLMKADSVLLEPWYEFMLTLPSENLGRAMTDLERMGAQIMSPALSGEVAVLQGTAPVAVLSGYHTELAGYTRGKGTLACTVKEYAPCHNTEEVIKSFRYDAESDVENTPDSVFCAHGAGFNVKWNEVEDYMHIKESAPSEEVREKVSDYISRVATDSELLAIFERTYGPVKRVREQTKKVYHAAPDKPKPKPVKEIGEEYLLVDGYNIIFAWEELKALAQESLDLARNRLIHMLCNYQGVVGCNLILVFDAYKVKGNEREVERVHNISVVYTKEAETADMYIEKTAHALAKRNRVRVATSDSVEQIIILAGGAYKVSAENFLREVKMTEQAIAEYLEQQ